MSSVIVKTPFENDPFVTIPLEEGESIKTEVDDHGALVVYSVPSGAVSPGGVLIRFASGSWNYVLTGDITVDAK